MDNDEIAEEYCGSSASDRFGIALNQARQSERAEIVEVLEGMLGELDRDVWTDEDEISKSGQQYILKEAIKEIKEMK